MPTPWLLVWLAWAAVARHEEGPKGVSCVLGRHGSKPSKCFFADDEKGEICAFDVASGTVSSIDDVQWSPSDAKAVANKFVSKGQRGPHRGLLPNVHGVLAHRLARPACLPLPGVPSSCVAVNASDVLFLAPTDLYRVVVVDQRWRGSGAWSVAAPGGKRWAVQHFVLWTSSNGTEHLLVSSQKDTFHLVRIDLARGNNFVELVDTKLARSFNAKGTLAHGIARVETPRGSELWYANQLNVLRLRVEDESGRMLEKAQLVGEMGGRGNWMGILASGNTVVLLDRKYGIVYLGKTSATQIRQFRKISSHHRAPHGLSWWIEGKSFVVTETKTYEGRIIDLKGKTKKKETIHLPGKGKTCAAKG